MIRKLIERAFDEESKYIEIACLHDDTKPTTGIITGSLALEVDTGDVYAYDEVGTQWDKIAALGGGA